MGAIEFFRDTFCLHLVGRERERESIEAKVYFAVSGTERYRHVAGL